MRAASGQQTAQIVRGLWGSMWCDITSLFGFSCSENSADSVLVTSEPVVPSATEKRNVAILPTPTVLSTPNERNSPIAATTVVTVPKHTEALSDFLTSASYVTMDDFATGLIILRRETQDAIDRVVTRRALRSTDDTAENVFDSIATVTQEKLSLTGGTLTGGLSGTEATFSTLTATLVSATRLAVTGTATSTIAGDVAFDTDMLYLDSINNRVGIGTTSPGSSLSVAGNGYFSGTGFFGGVITGTSTLAIQSTTATSTFSTGGLTVGTSQFVIQQTSGNVGLGTTSPEARLDIVQGVNGQTILRGRRITDTAPSGDFLRFTSADGATNLFRVDNSGNLTGGGIISSGAISILSTSQPQLRVQYDASNEVTTGVTSAGVTTYGFNGTTPLARWTPQSNSTNTFSFTDASSNSIFSVDTTNQRVGIATTTPNNLLDIYSTTKSAISFSGASGSTYKWTMGMDVTNGGRFSIASSIALGTTDRFVIDGNGNVGVGTTSPWGRLSADTTSLAAGVPSFVVGSSTRTDLVVTQSGNVGIGTVSPVSADGSARTLQVGSNFIFQNVIGTQTLMSNNAYYDGAWKYANSAAASAIRFKGLNNAGEITFTIAPSGTTGNTLSTCSRSPQQQTDKRQHDHLTTRRQFLLTVFP